MNSLNKKLLKRLPKKYHKRFLKLEEESDLIDNCKYMLYLNLSFNILEDGCHSIPVNSISESIHFIKSAWRN